MIHRCCAVGIDDAVPGTVLAEPILDAHGGALLPAGSTLTNSTLQSLRRRGIDRIMVVNRHVSEADLAAEREQVQQRLAKLFRKHADNDKNRLLLQYVTAYRSGEPS
ncbi:MAG TPA: hypothetical protein VEC06_15120 [Paucimonas sp.]|nr:hypothetical protein [Paucimonas sp.]